MLKQAEYTQEHRFIIYHQVAKKKYTVVKIFQIFGISRKTYYNGKNEIMGREISSIVRQKASRNLN